MAQRQSDATVHIVIPVHNRRSFTQRCLDGLRSQTFTGFRIVVVDDGSSDGTDAMIRSDYPEVTLLTGTGSLWWTGSTNMGVGFVLATASSDDLVLTLNDDTIPGPEYLASLLEARAEVPNAVLGSLLVSDSDGRTIVDGGTRVGWFSAKYRVQRAGEDALAPHSSTPALTPSDVLSGCGTLVPVDVYRQVGLYDPRLPHYGADYEFSRRALLAGHPLYVGNHAVLVTLDRETGLHSRVDQGGLARFLWSLWSIRSANSLRYRWRYARRVCPWYLLAPYVACDVGRVLIGSVRRARGGRPS